jgi:hypothetical protein
MITESGVICAYLDFKTSNKLYWLPNTEKFLLRILEKKTYASHTNRMQKAANM